MKPIAARSTRLALLAATSGVIETLEQRTLLSATVTLEDRVWVIESDDEGNSADRIVVRLNPEDLAKVQVLFGDAVVAEIKKRKLDAIEIYAGEGNDRVQVRIDEPEIDVEVYGGEGDDTLTGDEGDEAFFGEEGDDWLEGLGGDDDLSGGFGDDGVIGGAGDDDLDGNGNADTLAGGLGEDDLAGGGGDDQVQGGFGEDEIDGNKGKDTLRGGDGADELDGGRGVDTVFWQRRYDVAHFQKFDIKKADQLVNRLKGVGGNAELKQWLIDSAIRRWKWAFGNDAYQYAWWRYGGPVFANGTDGVAQGGGSGSVPSTPLPPSKESTDHSNTNTQEEGVDEADLVKTDGEYLYILTGQELVIVDARPAADAKVVSRTAIEGYATGIYLQGDRVVVLSQDYGFVRGGALTRVTPGWDGYYRASTNVTVYDVSDRKEPEVTEETNIDGSVSSSRLIDGRLYLVVDNNLNLPTPKLIEVEDPGDDGKDDVIVLEGEVKRGAIGIPPYGGGKRYLYEDEASYRARLEKLSIEELLPGYTTTKKADGKTVTTSGSLVSPGKTLIPDNPDAEAYNVFSVALVDVNDDEPGVESSTSVMGFAGEVYVSQESLYVTRTTWDAPTGEWDGELKTDLYKFDLGKDQVSFDASGQVPGWLLNSFSMDEETNAEDGTTFRIATTSDVESAGATGNSVFVLKEQGDDLKVVGGVTELAIGERIYSARFIGDRAYVVTFRQVDPLFTIDLSDPENPTLEGVLKIPGYSAYLHPVGKNLLIGVGRDADENTGRVKGVQVSLFDVAAAKNPKRLGVYGFANDDNQNWNGGGWSAAEWDHHAFSYFKEQGILALPVVSWNAYDFGSKGGLELLQIDPDASSPDGVFTHLGTIEHDGQPSRSVRIGQFLYSIGDDAVKVVSLDDPDVIVADVELSEGL